MSISLLFTPPTVSHSHATFFLSLPHALSFWLSQLIGGLADEKVRWAESVAHFDSMLVNVVGDVMVSAGAVAYLGSFTVSQGCCMHAQLVV